MTPFDWKRWIAGLAITGAIGTVAPSALAQEEAADTADEVAVEDDTDLDKDAAEAGDDIVEGEQMAEEDPNKVFNQPIRAPQDAPDGFQRELDSFQSAFKRYAGEIDDYQMTVDSIVDAEYRRKVAKINAFYDAKITGNEAIERQYRNDAIATFEEFLDKHPAEERYTPDAMFRLAELYFEKANDDFLIADEQYQEQLEQYEAGKIPDPPEEPRRDYTKTAETFERLITDWPDYRLLDGAYYLLAYTKLQMGEAAEARDLFAKLIVERPDSEFVPEACSTSPAPPTGRRCSTRTPRISTRRSTSWPGRITDRTTSTPPFGTSSGSSSSPIAVSASRAAPVRSCAKSPFSTSPSPWPKRTGISTVRRTRTSG